MHCSAEASHGCSRWVVSGTIQAHSFPLAAVQPYQARLLQQVVQARSQLPAVDSTASAARSMCSSGSSSSTSLIFQALQLLLRHATPATSSTACSQHAPAAPSCQQQLHQHRITTMQQPCGAGHSKQQRRATAHRCQICHASTCCFASARVRCPHHISIHSYPSLACRHRVCATSHSAVHKDPSNIAAGHNSGTCDRRQVLLRPWRQLHLTCSTSLQRAFPTTRRTRSCAGFVFPPAQLPPP